MLKMIKMSFLKKIFKKEGLKEKPGEEMSGRQKKESKRKKELKKRLLTSQPFTRENVLKDIKERRKRKFVSFFGSLGRKIRVKDYLEQAGLAIEHSRLSKLIFHICVFINILVSGYFIYTLSKKPDFEWLYVGTMMVIIWVGVFLFVLFLLWLLMYIIIDLKVFKRGRDIEEVLPDFFQLTAANISGGMPTDKALWSAVRPRFGVLAKEIELVAKETLSGAELGSALQKFAAKYDSKLLKRSINLLTEGIEAGGEIGELLNKISDNLKDTQLMKKEMAANVTNYVIFISFSSVIGAPVLLALAGTLLNVITGILSQINIPEGVSNISFSISEVSISSMDFHIFAISCLTVTAVFTSIIIAIINKGEVRAGAKYIPIYVGTTWVIYLAATFLFSNFIGGFF